MCLWKIKKTFTFSFPFIKEQKKLETYFFVCNHDKEVTRLDNRSFQSFKNLLESFWDQHGLNFNGIALQPIWTQSWAVIEAVRRLSVD